MHPRGLLPNVVMIVLRRAGRWSISWKNALARSRLRIHQALGQRVVVGVHADEAVQFHLPVEQHLVHRRQRAQMRQLLAARVPERAASSIALEWWRWRPRCTSAARARSGPRSRQMCARAGRWSCGGQGVVLHLLARREVSRPHAPAAAPKLEVGIGENLRASMPKAVIWGGPPLVVMHSYP